MVLRTERVVLLRYERDGGARRGSGLRVRGDLVLTARHCARGQRHLVIVDGRQYDATVLWSSDRDDVDIALLSAPTLPALSSLECSLVDTTIAGTIKECVALGFPRWYEDSRVQSNGWVDGAQGIDAYASPGDPPVLTFKLTDPEAQVIEVTEGAQDADESPWGGMSGAVIVSADDLIVGVIRGHVRRAGTGSLTFTPLNGINALELSQQHSFWEHMGVDDPRKLTVLPRPVPVAPEPILERDRDTSLAGVASRTGRPSGRIGDEVRPVSIAKWLRGEAFRADTPSAVVNHIEALARAVAKQEGKRVLELGAGKTEVETDLAFAEQVLDDEGRYVDTPSSRDTIANIGTFYRRRVSHGRLVILGQAGSGKTVAAIHLILQLLGHPNDRAWIHTGEPVPVRVNLAGWDGESDFSPWLATQLTTNIAGYRRRSKVGLDLITENRIVPVLDSLDEMDDSFELRSRAKRVVEQLNRGTWRQQPVVLTCRSEGYSSLVAAGHGLDNATHIELKPLAANQIAAYLQRQRSARPHGVRVEDWEPVFTELRNRPDGILATALASPWLLSLSVLALRYSAKDTARLLRDCESVDDVREALFGSLIPSAIEASHDDTDRRAARYTAEQVRVWLGTLARHLQESRSAGGGQIALDQVWKLAGRRKVVVLHTLSTVLLIILMALAARQVGVVYAYGTSPAVEYYYLFLAFIVFVGLPLAIGIGIRAFVGRTGTSRFAWRVPGHRRWPRGILAGAVTGTVVASAGLLWATLLLGAPYFMFGRELIGEIAVPIAVAVVVGIAVNVLISRDGTKAVAGRVIGQRYRLHQRGPAIAVTSAALVGAVCFWALARPATPFVVPTLLLAGSLGAVTGVVTGIIVAFDTSAEERLALGQSGENLIRDDARAGLVFGLATAILFGMATSRTLRPDETMFGPHVDSVPVQLTFLAGNLILGLLIAVLVARVTGRHAIASLLFGGRAFSHQPAAFLTWARDTRLLRMTGIAFQFRHDTYLRWLAAQPDKR